MVCYLACCGNSSFWFKGAFQSTKYDDGIIVPKLFYSMRTGGELGKAGGETDKAGGETSGQECVLSVEDLSLALSEQTETKILTEPADTGTTGNTLSTTVGSVSQRRFLEPSERPEEPLVAHYEASVPVSQVWDRDYRISHFERIVYPQSFR